MKRKNLLFALVLMLPLGIISCKKDSEAKEFCIACTIKEIQTVTGEEPIEGTLTYEGCGYTSALYDEYLKAGNVTVTGSSGGMTYTLKRETKCTKK